MLHLTIIRKPFVSRFVYYDFCVTLSILLAVLFNPLCNLLGFCEIVANNY